MDADGRRWVENLPGEMSGQREILRGLLRACEADDNIRWLVVACSVGRGAGDHLSDLDLGMGVRDEAFAAALGDVRRHVDGLGELVESFSHKIAGLTTEHERIFAQYADRCQVDLVVIPASQAVGAIRDQVVLYNPGGHAFDTFEQQPVTPGQVREWAFHGWCALADLGKYLRRGSAWEALDRLHEARARLWQLWAVAADVPNPQYGLTSVLDFAPQQLPEPAAATVSDLDPARLLAAGQSLAAQLAAIGARLSAEAGSALPGAMARFVVGDLASVTLGEQAN